MSSHIERVTADLRQRILNGELAPGQRVRELEWAPILGVSRTPLRLALVELEKQGLVETRGVKGGFHVRHVTMDEIVQAIDVRGVLEGYATRLVAEKGMSAAVSSTLSECVTEGRAIVDAAEDGAEPLDVAAWVAMNARFHRTLIDAAENPVLKQALAQVVRSPFADTTAILIRSPQTTRLELAFLKRAQHDHEDVLEALNQREGARVEALMREHARRSRDNKLRLAQEASSMLAPPA